MAARPRRSKQKLNPLVEHGEKLAFGLLVLALGWAVYGAITHPTYEKLPEQLKQSAEAKLTQIRTATPDETFGEQFPTENFADKVKVANQPIDPKPFQFPTALNFDGSSGLGEKRGQPELLPLEEISARFVRMSLAITPPAVVAGAPGVPGGAPVPRPRAGGLGEDMELEGRVGPARPLGVVGETEVGGVKAPQGSIPKGKMAIVVVGRVPVKKQTELFRKAFQNSRFNDAQRDAPSYVSFMIERADVTDEKDEANPKWTSVDVANQSLIIANLLETKEWALEAPEIVDLRHVRRLALNQNGPVPWEGFTFPLPPRLLEDWSTEVTSKTIKKLDPEALLGVPGQLPGTEPVPVPAGGNPFNNPQPANPFQNQPGAAPGFERGANNARNRQHFVAQQLPGARVPGAFGGPRRNPDMEGMAGGTRSLQPGDEIPDLLLRFFDFQVQLNHRYRYRVQLVLHNPNFELPDRYLQSADLGKNRYVFSPESDPSPAVAVSGFSEVLAGPVKPSVGISDASASIIIRNRDAETGATIAYEFPGVERGTLMNFTVVKKVARDKSESGALKPNPVTEEVTVADKAVFNSNEILLDMRGGDKVPGSPTNRVEEPSGVLVLDESGRLAVRGPLAEQQTDFVEAKARLEVLSTKVVKPETEEKKEDEEGRPPRRGNGLGGRVGGDV